MEGVSVDGRDGQFIKTVSERLVRFTCDVSAKRGEWERRLAADPQNLDALEHEVPHEFVRGAGLVGGRFDRGGDADKRVCHSG